MKSVIMTTALSLNYGASLQSYALAKSIEKMGLEVEVYSYMDLKRITYGMSITKKLKHFAWKAVKELLYGRDKERGFKEFRKRFVPMTREEYKNNGELRSNPGFYDVYIAGSDQIWNPDFFQYDLSYFLDFVPQGKKKISYASSFAKKEFNSSLREECGKLLADFSSISVREQSGVGIVKSLCNKHAETVLDPTLLLSSDEWKSITTDASPKSKNFDGILCYVMPGDNMVTNAIEKNANMIQTLTNLPIMRLGIKEYNRYKYSAEETDIHASPVDFVQYFLNAKYIITNSFHGTAFAINFGKQLIVPYNDGLSANETIQERVTSLLDSVDSMSVVIPASSVIDRLPQRDVHHATVLLEAERNKSKAYLEHSLMGK